MLFKFVLMCLLGMAFCQGNKDPLPFTTTTDDPSNTTTTTPAHTTTPAPPETTTPPATTTPATPTTTSAPTPVPPPEIGTWSVTDATKNETCVMAQMALQISVNYTLTNNKTGTAIIDVPANTSIASGSCGNETQSLVISWTPEGTNQSNSLMLEFALNSTTKMYHVTEINITLYPDATSFPGAASKDALVLTAGMADLPSAPVSKSYRCLPLQKLNLTGNAMLSVSQLQLQAFHEAGDSKFGAVIDCAAADSADIVPIAVGCALAGLVVIVLIAYLIGRRRSHAKGYLSM